MTTSPVSWTWSPRFDLTFFFYLINGFKTNINKISYCKKVAYNSCFLTRMNFGGSNTCVLVTSNNCALLLVKKVSERWVFKGLQFSTWRVATVQTKTKRMRNVWYMRANGTKCSFVSFQFLWTKRKKKFLCLGRTKGKNILVDVNRWNLGENGTSKNIICGEPKIWEEKYVKNVWLLRY